ncbi:MAG: plasmid pRiA4b ORF-3 family protein [Rhodoferax sp.]|nr:plasmid pRiA4b ORF-3 family protein [Rhodoferax sp.]
MVTRTHVSTYQIKVTLVDSKPPIWRRLLVPSTVSLEELHSVLQIAMGWTDYHLHMFRAGDRYFGVPSRDFFDMEDEALVKLNEVLVNEKYSIRYEYDFGDDWRHKIVLEKILPVDPGVPLPCCTAGKRACPPEDCGGIWGYADFLVAIQDPKHPEHQDMLEWVGVDFDPESFDRDTVNTRFAIRY